MPTLLLSRTCQPEADRLAIIANGARWHHQWLGRRNVPTQLHGNDFGLYAETDTALRVSQQHQLALIEPSFDLLAHLPFKFTRREIKYMTLGDALRIRDRSFIKPADCTNKAFDAAVWNAGKYILCADDLSRETPVLVSEPVSWDVEYRVIVLERNVITYSPYIRGGWLARDQDDRWPCPKEEAAGLLSLCEMLLADDSVSLPPVFTLDIGIIEDRGCAVIEFNPVWCAGLLGCDLSKMLPVFHRACRRRSELTDADAAWVVDRAARQSRTNR
ncbi:MAG: ATP-grasp domain-containing protein [Pirellulales bacterium]